MNNKLLALAILSWFSGVHLVSAQAPDKLKAQAAVQSCSTQTVAVQTTGVTCPLCECVEGGQACRKKEKASRG
jgi:hypothetical protein